MKKKKKSQKKYKSNKMESLLRKSDNNQEQKKAGTTNFSVFERAKGEVSWMFPQKQYLAHQASFHVQI